MDSNHRSLAGTGRDAVRTPGLPQDGMRPGYQPATADAGPPAGEWTFSVSLVLSGYQLWQAAQRISALST